MQKRTINTISRVELTNIVKKSPTFTEILRAMGYKNSGGGSWFSLKKKLHEYNIDYSHIIEGRDVIKAHNLAKRRATDEELFCIDSKCSRKAVKSRILGDGLLPYVCDICGIGSTWNDKPLTLRLDHKNGINNDHRLDNLRFACPNCDSQLPTYGGRNVKHKFKMLRTCLVCDAAISKHSKSGLCTLCARRNRNSIKWPSDQKLATLVWQMPSVAIASALNVSDSAVAKRCRKRGITKPAKGYWSKKSNE